MNARRVAIVTRRFWPLVGDEETALADLAVGLANAGVRPTIVTAAWGKHWPATFAFEGIPVVRLPKPAGHWWGDWGYAKRLRQWLHSQRERIDVALVASVGADAEAAVAAMGTSVPVVVMGRTSDFAKLSKKPHLLPDAFVTCAEPTEEIVADPHVDQLFKVIRPGVQLPQLISGDQRRRARLALAKACGDARISALTPLAIAAGRIDQRGDYSTFIRAWKSVLARHADARLWIFGEGRQRATLWDEVDNANLRGRVFLPGGVDILSEAFSAADLFLASDDNSSISPATLSAMAAGLPVVARASSAAGNLLTSNHDGLLFDAEDSEDLQVAIERLLAQPTLRNVLGTNARRLVKEQYNLEDRVRRFIELFDELQQGKAS